MKRSSKILLIVVFLAFFVFVSLTRGRNRPLYVSQNSLPPATANIPHGTISGKKIVAKDKFQAPIDQIKDRATKKPFGIFITPKNSPIKPERFYGYHTGTDFEISSDELNKDVPIKAICDGNILSKRWAGGYGGILVQSCVLNSQPVTVIYGHLNIKSVAKQSGEKLLIGEQIGILGRNKSPETNGERKHLHLGIHKGTGIDIRGYVKNKSQLENWIDPMSVL